MKRNALGCCFATSLMAFLAPLLPASSPAPLELATALEPAAGEQSAGEQSTGEQSTNGQSTDEQPARPTSSFRNAQWPQWRGPLATGEAPLADPPVRWSESENVRFKVELPGMGHSTPVLWDERLFLTTAVPVGESFKPRYTEAPGAHDNAPVSRRHDFVVLAVERSDGAIAWRTKVRSEIPWQGMHRSGSYASPSPVTDGEVLIAPFGSHGIHGLNLNGRILWQRDFGRMKIKHAHGEGGSPALHGDFAVLVWDHEGASFLVALDRLTGEERWRVERNQGTSWATPIVVERRGKAQVIVAGTDRLRGHDLVTGRELWQVGGLSANVVASPVSADGLVFAGSSYEHQIMMAINLEGARGDLTAGKNVLWQRSRGTPYVPSPLLYDGALYFHNHYQSVLTRIDAKDGRETPGPFRLPGIRNVYGSPVAAAGRIYITDLSGTTVVLNHSEQPGVLARNRLDDSFSASAVIAGREIYLRGHRSLYALAVAKEGADAADKNPPPR